MTMLSPIREFIDDKHWQCAIVAHRGAWGPQPENSVGALQEAITRGYQFVEIDVRESFDGTFYCLHDATLDRMTSGSGNVARTWDSLCNERLRVGNGGSNAAITKFPIASFEQLMEIAKGQLYIDVDVKLLHQLERVATCIRGAGMASFVNLKMDIYSQSDLTDLLDLERSTGILVKPVMRIDATNLNQMQTVLKRYQFPIVEVLLDTWETTLSISNTATTVGTDLFVNTLDDVPSCVVTDSRSKTDPEGVWGKIIGSGIRHIQTDVPDLLSDYLKE